MSVIIIIWLAGLTSHSKRYSWHAVNQFSSQLFCLFIWKVRWSRTHLHCYLVFFVFSLSSFSAASLAQKSSSDTLCNCLCRIWHFSNCWCGNREFIWVFTGRQAAVQWPESSLSTASVDGGRALDPVPVTARWWWWRWASGRRWNLGRAAGGLLIAGEWWWFWVLARATYSHGRGGCDACKVCLFRNGPQQLWSSNTTNCVLPFGMRWELSRISHEQEIVTLFLSHLEHWDSP